MKKESNILKTQISYSRRLAYGGLAGVAFGLYLLSYLRRQIKDQNIEARLDAVENGQLVIGPGQGQLANGPGQGELANGPGQGELANGPGQGAQVLQVMPNPWNDPNLPVRRVGTPGRREGQQARLQIQNNPGGGRRQTKKRRRQTKKPRRITRKRRRM